MKKTLSVLLVLIVAFSVFAKGGTETKTATYRVAMVTDYGDITDQSFNQITYEACRDFSADYGIDFNYFKPAGDSDADRQASIEKAIDQGYNIIVTPGFAFAGAVKAAAGDNPDIKFITLDVGEGDWGDYKLPANVYSAVYAEQYSGFMAGYAAVKMGFTKLGFLGGMAAPAVKRYGYGFVQGADQAATELGKKIELKYIYGNQFFGDPDITAAMETWYAAGTQVVFACGGGIWTSAAEAAAKYNQKIIGVDVDQQSIIDGKFGNGLTVTSAIKGLRPATYNTLADVIRNDNWGKYSGKQETLGLISATDPYANYVGIGESTQFNSGFSKEDLVTLTGKLFNRQYKVNDETVEPVTKSFKFEDLGFIK